MALQRVVSEALMRPEDLKGIEVVKIASTRNTAGDVIAEQPDPMVDTIAPDRAPPRDRPTLTVFIDDPDDAEAPARIAAALGIDPDNGWY